MGFLFNDDETTEDELEDRSQTLDLWEGSISSSFTYKGQRVLVETWVDPHSDTVGISVNSSLLADGTLGIFLDFPLPTRNKFDAPFVGVFNATANHTTTLQDGSRRASIRHDLDETTYFTSVSWGDNADLSGPVNDTHRYLLKPANGTSSLRLSVSYSSTSDPEIPSFADLTAASSSWWESFWNSGAFIDLTSSTSPNATELQRRTILSQYLVAVNSASSNPPQG